MAAGQPLLQRFFDHIGAAERSMQLHHSKLAVIRAVKELVSGVPGVSRFSNSTPRLGDGAVKFIAVM